MAICIFAVAPFINITVLSLFFIVFYTYRNSFPASFTNILYTFTLNYNFVSNLISLSLLIRRMLNHHFSNILRDSDIIILLPTISITFSKSSSTNSLSYLSRTISVPLKMSYWLDSILTMVASNRTWCNLRRTTTAFPSCDSRLS